MRLSEEIRDPWALLIAGVAGGAAWAVGIPAVAAAAVGAAVLGVKAVVGSLSGRPPASSGGRELPIRRGSPEQRFVQRAERAAGRLRDLASSVRPGPVADRCAAISSQAATTLDAISRVAGQASAVGAALGQMDAPRLAADEERLASDRRRVREPDVKVEVERSLEAVRSQIAVHDRLAQAGRALLARLESGAIGVEALVARLAEVLALTETRGEERLETIDELADQLEGLRTGLAETEEASRKALSAYRAQAS